MEAVTVRTFSPADKEACLAVFDSNRPKFFSDSERPQFSAFLDRLPSPYLVLVDRSGRVVACGGYEPGMHRCEMEWTINRATTDFGAPGETS